MSSAATKVRAATTSTDDRQPQGHRGARWRIVDWVLGVPAVLAIAYVVARCEVSHDRRELDSLGFFGFCAAPVLLVYTITLFLRGRTLFGSVPRKATVAVAIPLVLLALLGFLCAMSMMVAANL